MVTLVSAIVLYSLCTLIVYNVNDKCIDLCSRLTRDCFRKAFLITKLTYLNACAQITLLCHM